MFLKYATNQTYAYSPTLCFSFIFLINSAALGANGILVESEISIYSTDTIGGKSIGALLIKGKLKAVKIIIKA